jgi:homoserine dehydrogenase
MECAGFLDLPEWQDKLQQIFTSLGRKDLIRIPVLGCENVDKPWVALEATDFFSAVETGILFSGKNFSERFPRILITADAEIALERISAGHYAETFFSAAIGATFPATNFFSSEISVTHPARILTQNDSVTGFILTGMESREITLEKAISEAQWKKIASINPSLNLHGIVTRNRLALQIAEIFNVLVPVEQIQTFGVATLELTDMTIAKNMGYSIRLLGIARNENDLIQASVEPCVIPDRFLLAQARGGSEIIYSQQSDGQAQVYACPGTEYETIVNGLLTDLQSDKRKHKKIKRNVKVEDFAERFFVRLSVVNLADTLAKVLNVFSENGLGIESVIQPAVQVSRETESGISTTFVLITESTKRAFIRKIVDIINASVKLASVCSIFRFIK